jgi:type IV secretion system protein VirB2
LLLGTMSGTSERLRPKSDIRIPINATLWKRNSAMHHPCTRRFTRKHHAVRLLLTSLVSITPELALAQASPFMTGATALQTNILAWLTPVAIILVMVLGGMAMANRMSWGWCIGAIFGIAIAFGAPQIVTWVRGMFGV